MRNINIFLFLQFLGVISMVGKGFFCEKSAVLLFIFKTNEKHDWFMTIAFLWNEAC